MVVDNKNKNYEENLQLAEKIVSKELIYEESRYEHIQKKSSIYLGFVSVFILLLLNLYSGSITIEKDKRIIIPIVYILYLGLGFLFLSIFFSIIASKPRKFKRPNITYEGKGLLITEEMEKSSVVYNTYVLKNFVDIILLNAKVNDNCANWLLIAVISFLIGFLLTSFSLIIGLI